MDYASDSNIENVLIYLRYQTDPEEIANSGFDFKCKRVKGGILITSRHAGSTLSILECLIHSKWTPRLEGGAYILGYNWICNDKHDRVIRYALLGKYGEDGLIFKAKMKF